MTGAADIVTAKVTPPVQAQPQRLALQEAQLRLLVDPPRPLPLLIRLQVLLRLE